MSLVISGGIFHDCGVHDIDFVCWMLGEYPESVYTQAHVHVKEIADMDDVDTVAITMKFPSGTLAMLDLSRNANYGYDQRVEVRMKCCQTFEVIPEGFFLYEVKVFAEET